MTPFGGAVFALNIGGLSVDAKINPILIQLEVQLTEGSNSDNLAITLDDTGGQIALPSPGAQVTLDLGWPWSGLGRVFEGVVDEAHAGDGEGGDGVDDAHAANHHMHGVHGGGKVGRMGSRAGRAGGRTLTISCNAADTTGKLKQRQDAHADGGDFKSAASKFAQAAGIGSCDVHESLASIQRPYWSIANESFWQWGDRVSQEIGATFKVYPGRAVFVPRSGNQSASGQALTGLRAAWGDNLIESQIAPVVSRAAFGSFLVRWYDVHAAEWKTEQAAAAGSSGVIGSDAAAAAHVHPFKAPDQAQAKAQAQSNADEGDRERGCGDYVVIVGDPAAQPQAQVTVSGVRPGVDGTYTVKEVTHSLNRSAGYLTQMSVIQPGGGAGTDSRGGAGEQAAPAPAGNDASAGATPGLKTGSNGMVVGPV